MPPTSGIRRSGETCRVLVVEDDYDSAEALCILVQQGGHDCQVALNADEARAITEDFTPDVALIDIGLPGETGYDLIKTLKSSLVGCRFVAMTGYGGAEMSEKSVDAGFEAHLTKPVAMHLLMAVLDQCAGSSGQLIRPGS
jgi:DNA-binding response OmpR family regulator